MQQGAGGTWSVGHGIVQLQVLAVLWALEASAMGDLQMSAVWTKWGGQIGSKVAAAEPS
jgi:hypothetical protein